MAKTARKSLPPELRLGTVAVKMGFITQAQLEDAIAFQERRGMQEYLGSILLMLDYLSPKTLTQVLAEQKRLIAKASHVEALPTTPAGQNRFGDIAIRMGLVSAARLEEAVRIQQQSSPRPFIGAVLLDHGYIGADDIPRILARQFSAAEESSSVLPAVAAEKPRAVPEEKPKAAAAKPPPAPVPVIPLGAAPPGRPAPAKAPAPARPAAAPAKPAPPKPLPAAPLTAADLQLGRIAVRMGFMTQSELDEALDIQKRRSPRPFLGSLLVELGTLSSKSLAKVLAEQVGLMAQASKVPAVPRGKAEEGKFGRIAINCGFITGAQLDEALGIQTRSSPKPFLGAVLVDLGYLSPRQLSKILAAQAAGEGFSVS